MKALLLKDLYNLWHQKNSILWVFAIFTVFFLYFSGFAGYLLVCTVLFSQMISTTFNLDHQSNWTAYALTMPITRRQLAVSKFLVLLLLCGIGLGMSLILGVAFCTVTHDFGELKTPLRFLGAVAAALFFSLSSGSVTIALFFRFGIEKARMLKLFGFLLPAGALVIVILFLQKCFFVSDHTISLLLLFSPLLALLLMAGMLAYSEAVLRKKEW